MTMSAPLRQFTLTAHVLASVGWAGALAVFLAHALAGLVSPDEQTVRAVSLAMGITAWYVILPLSLSSLTTGLIQALGTAWGLFRHYWIVFKLLLTAAATIVLLMKLGPISYLADKAAETTFSTTDLIQLRTSVVLHAIGGLLVLLAAATLAIYKPQALTKYGRRKQSEHDNIKTTPSPGTIVKSPFWVKGRYVIIAILILMVGIMFIGGNHGPGAH